MALNKKIKCNQEEIPFKASLSFELVVDELEELRKAGSIKGKIANDILETFDKSPLLKEQEIKKSTIEENSELIEFMMAFINGTVNENGVMTSIRSPFEEVPFYANTSYKNGVINKKCKVEYVNKATNQKMIQSLYQAYKMIMTKFYDINMSEEFPIILKYTNLDDQTVRYYKDQQSFKYLKVIPKANVKKLNEDELKDLFNHSSDLDYWNEKIPVKDFEFRGFIHSQFIDVTHTYLLSELKSDLLNNDSFINEHFNAIRDKVRTFVDNPKLKIGFVFANEFDANKCDETLFKSIITHTGFKREDYIDSVYGRLRNEQKTIVTKDFQDQTKSKIAQTYLKKGIRSHAIIPLVLDGKPLGIMELGSPNPNEITMYQVIKLYDLYPIFALVAKRSNDEWADKIRAVIQKKFTAIHPSVEWKFRDAVSSLISDSKNEVTSAIDPIVFDDIVPIYGASDIRASSIERSKAVQSDLSEQLHMAVSILENHTQLNEMPLLSDLRFKIEQQFPNVNRGLNAGDEFTIVDFLKKDVNPVFKLLLDRFGDPEDQIKAYFDALDPDLGILYKKRKDFEDSLTLINNEVSEIIDKEQEKAQDIFPHYFEKYRTDGVEYNAYIGQSLVQNLKYDEIYLRNIRLWQLLVKVKIARAVKKIQPQLTTKLDITQLILVHSSPFSIEFRQDEKKFDVAGAYNIRYEITKKRIDKAQVKGTQERVTQVGKIAIIYSHSDEINEYRDFIRYMVAKGYLTDAVEELELEDLKGASGLKALRLEIDFSDLSPIDISLKEAEIVSN